LPASQKEPSEFRTALFADAMLNGQNLLVKAGRGAQLTLVLLCAVDSSRFKKMFPLGEPTAGNHVDFTMKILKLKLPDAVFMATDGGAAHNLIMC